MYTVYFPYDTTRAREEDLSNLLSGLMQDAPPDSVGVVDTMGCATPEAIKYMVRKVKTLTGLPVEIHTHNDFGMGVAAELAAVTAGAEVVHSCVNGLGERTGNAALEELMIGLHMLLGYETQYDFKELISLCKLVEDISGVKTATNKPVTGSGNYTRGIRYRSGHGNENTSCHVCHGSKFLRAIGRSGARQKERQSLHYLHAR